MATTIFQSHELHPSEEIGIGSPALENGAWSIDAYAREQLRSLVRQLFLSDAARRVRQVIFSAAEPETDVVTICRLVGESLAAEVRASVVVVAGDPLAIEEASPAREGRDCNYNDPHAHSFARRAKSNLWLAPNLDFSSADFLAGELYTPRLRYARITELRREFDYSIVESQPAGESSDVLALGQIADGVVLVLEAHRTRRATARSMSQMLSSAGVKLLGTVLSGRTFPIPEGIYKRL